VWPCASLTSPSKGPKACPVFSIAQNGFEGRLLFGRAIQIDPALAEGLLAAEAHDALAGRVPVEDPRVPVIDLDAYRRSQVDDRAQLLLELPDALCHLGRALFERRHFNDRAALRYRWVLPSRNRLGIRDAAPQASL
jgi:hypothetical protein